MSARDEAIKAAEDALPMTLWEVAPVVLDAAHAAGAIVYADELEQVAELGPKGISWSSSLVNSITPVPVYRKRPQEPNE